ncbi:MAG TPA: phospholipid carrier-dependent glycosyltransferase [Candidatus Limnocylindria bacterium]|nr:phospholipid carrier-dependent glycosyltransferase [Candidatus Limnocylindria bacterium]
MTDRWARVLIAALAVAGVALRLRSVGSPGFPTDVSTFMAWAERLAELGPRGFYAPGYFSDYPPGFLYVLWGLGSALDGEALRLAVKAISIPFDVAIALIAAGLAWRAAGPAHAALAAALWLLAPGVIFAGPHWGQVDAVGTVPLLLALLAAGRGRWAAAGALAGLAAMVKPQFGIGLVALAATTAFVFIRIADWRPAVRLLAAAFAAVLALGLPFGAGPAELVALVRSAAEAYPYTSLYAFNPWSVLLDFWKADEGWVAVGGILLAAGIVASCAPLWWRRDTAALLACAACAVMAFYFLPTRAHERYLFPALALLVPFAAVRARILRPYLVLQVLFFATLAIVFTVYDLLDPSDLVRSTLFGRTGEIVIAVVMTGTAALVAWRLVRGDARLEPTLALAAPPVDAARRWSLPAGLAPGGRPTRRDVLVALVVALVVLGTRGYRLDHPRDMYFDEIYHARTAFELLAEREVYEWTHPHLAKELMALGILAFGGERVIGAEPVPDGATALAVTEGVRAYALVDGRVVLRGAGGQESGSLAVGAPVRAIAVDGGRLYAATDTELVTASLEPPSLVDRSPLEGAGRTTSLAAASGRVLIGTDRGLEIRGPGGTRVVPGGVVAVTARPDGTAAYVLDREGTVRAIDTAAASETRAFAGRPGRSIAYALSPDSVFVGDASSAAVEVISLQEGTRERVALANARTGAVPGPVSALAVVPRTQFVYAVAGDRLVVVEPHGVSPFASLPARGPLLGVAGEEDSLVVAGAAGADVIETGRHALAWRLPGVLAAAVLAFFLVLFARRLFASALAPALVGAMVVLDGSMFAQARIGMNDIYVATFIVAGWYFVVAAHAPRLSARLDLLIAGVSFGLALASKWVAAYALAALALATLGVTARAWAQRRAGQGGPLDLLGGRGTSAAFLAVSFALVPLAIYVASYLPWFGGKTIPYGWSLVEVTQQMYWYHSSLTAPHPAGSPWWSWPIVLKPVYWYYSASDGGSAVIYDAGNVVLFWSALAATVWCAVAAVRARSVVLGFIVFALLAQLVAWIPITRVLFFYHFFTALPFYFLALVAACVALWETERRTLVAALGALAAASFAFFYPFVSGAPVPADQTGVFFILPTWQHECQFYPSFVCEVPLGVRVGTAAAIARFTIPVALFLLASGLWLVLSNERVREAAAGWWRRGPSPSP